MTVSVTAVLGLLFLGLSLLSTYLMFQFWGYPYDKDRRKSECPQWKMNIHRGVGYAYVIVYIVMMTQMVPRMWEYQIEFPARTVAHILLAITIGVLLLVKISIIRWFRHFEEWMPYLGVGLLLCTFLLVGLSMPFVLKERALAEGGIGGSAFSAENRERVRGLLPGAGLPEDASLDELASERSLQKGRRVLLTQCIYCHDLKTAISRPRTPADWVRTVRRMADKPTLGRRISDIDAQRVSAYLIAITPELQDSAAAKRKADERKGRALGAVKELRGPEPDEEAEERGELEGSDEGSDEDGAAASAPAPAPAPVDPAAARAEFERVCAQCHELGETDQSPPRTAAEVDELIERMVENGMEEEREVIELLRAYLVATYASP